MITRAMMSQQILIIAAGLVCIQGVSVDPDMMDSIMDDFPLQAESEDVFIFPSMRVSPLSLVRSSTKNVLTLHRMRPTPDLAPFLFKTPRMFSHFSASALPPCSVSEIFAKVLLLL